MPELKNKFTHQSVVILVSSQKKYLWLSNFSNNELTNTSYFKI